MGPAAIEGRQPGSFRDPSGYLFYDAGVLHRHVAREYAPHYDRLIASGLYDELAAAGRIVRHEEVAAGADPAAHRVLRPEPLPFVSYPYEWSFSQLRDAALLTLDLLEAALARGLVLKDASAFNIQFAGVRPLLVDTLSFEIHEEGAPWTAYRQFCEHFLAPLALAAWRDVRLIGLLRAHLDGIPLDLASALLPRRTWARPGLLAHVHLHARAQSRYADRAPARRPTVGRQALRALADSLRGTVGGLRAPSGPSTWSDYETTHDYSPAAEARKEQVVGGWLRGLRPRVVWDLGANVGRFGALAHEAGAYVVSLDADPAVVERAYARARDERRERLLPLLMDLANPTPGLGWDGRERDSLEARGPADAVLALALVHHLCLGRNVPLPHLARWLARIGRAAIVEFVPKDDPQARRLLRSRRDVFADYDEAAFERALGAHFDVTGRERLPESGRTLYRAVAR